ncbi:MAG: ProQ/FINO family protein [Acidovorax temperans]|uniref:ProQ/FINO family protein n=1 Tax=Acidovorax temperans TaxID=80878 RepID=UPI00391DAA8C
MMRGCFLRPLLQPACGLIATTMSADSSSPSPAPASADAAATGAGRARRGGKRQRPRNPAPAATTPDAAPGVAKAPRTPHPVLEQLADLYPHLFGAVFRPLKRGIFQDLLAAHPDAFEREALKVALGIHTRSTRYLQAVAAGEKRHDLQGQPVEAMAPEHVHHALLEVYRRRKNQKGRSTEDLLPKLRNRIIAAFESSGLTREAYTELVVGRDDAANAILEEAFAEWAARNAKAEALLRAFEASGSTLEQFADMYGMDPRSTGQQLERARKLAAAAQGNPSASAPAV